VTLVNESGLIAQRLVRGRVSDMNRVLQSELVEGEVGLVIDYKAGETVAVDVLQAAMGMINALDKLDAALLSSVDTSLQPVSVLNDVQHSSLKVLLARALKHVPDDAIHNLEWKKWVGALLVKGKYKLLQNLEADAPEIRNVLLELESDYRAAPVGLIGYTPPTVTEIRDALDRVVSARAALPGQRMEVQTELGDILIPETVMTNLDVPAEGPQQTVSNTGTEYFKIKSPDMLGSAQWQVMRNGRTVRVDMLHKSWLDRYHAREFTILPGDSLKCVFEETITYDSLGNEIDRQLSIIEVQDIISPPTQRGLL
jgi:hypothetical protein